MSPQDETCTVLKGELVQGLKTNNLHLFIFGSKYRSKQNMCEGCFCMRAFIMNTQKRTDLIDVIEWFSYSHVELNIRSRFTQPKLNLLKANVLHRKSP